MRLQIQRLVVYGKAPSALERIHCEAQALSLPLKFVPHPPSPPKFLSGGRGRTSDVSAPPFGQARAVSAEAGRPGPADTIGPHKVKQVRLVLCVCPRSENPTRMPVAFASKFLGKFLVSVFG